MTNVEIPNRPAFRAQEVCELAGVQPYVLRTWEAEFPDLGVASSPGGARVYRRADVERVLRIKQLLFDEGLTLAGARRRLGEEGAAASADQTDLFAEMDGQARAHLRELRRGLESILGLLSNNGAPPTEFALQPDALTDAASEPEHLGGTPTRSPKRASSAKKR